MKLLSEQPLVKNSNTSFCDLSVTRIKLRCVGKAPVIVEQAAAQLPGVAISSTVLLTEKLRRTATISPAAEIALRQLTEAVARLEDSVNNFSTVVRSNTNDQISLTIRSITHPRLNHGLATVPFSAAKGGTIDTTTSEELRRPITNLNSYISPDTKAELSLRGIKVIGQLCHKSFFDTNCSNLSIRAIREIGLALKSLGFGYDMEFDFGIIRAKAMPPEPLVIDVKQQSEALLTPISKIAPDLTRLTRRAFYRSWGANAPVAALLMNEKLMTGQDLLVDQHGLASFDAALQPIGLTIAIDQKSWPTGYYEEIRKVTLERAKALPLEDLLLSEALQKSQLEELKKQLPQCSTLAELSLAISTVPESGWIRNAVLPHLDYRLIRNGPFGDQR